ncbi:hypothetical protein CR513_56579, partial [Mucuna pruriens]
MPKIDDAKEFMKLVKDYLQYHITYNKKVKDNSINLMTHDGANTNKSKLGKKDKGKAQLKVNKGGVCKDKKCYFCKQSGHFKKDRPRVVLNIDGLYCFNLDAKFMESLFNVECVVGSKHNMHDDSSAQLWHQRLGHVSKERIMKLMKNENFPQLDFANQINIKRNSATRSIELLGLIYIDICGTFDVPFWGNEKYFIIFIDDFSHYCYVYLLHENSQSVDALKVFIYEVESQLDRKVKIVSSDRGGEFCGKFNESECPGLFEKFLESQGICAQYTMPNTP